MQLAACQRGLEHIACIDRAFGLPAPTIVCSSSMKTIVRPSSAAMS
jgi:hypothetical protein